MNKKSEKVVVTFQSATDAVSMERNLRKFGVESRTVPVPRSISASCGLCLISPIEFERDLIRVIQEKKLQYEKIYHRQMY